MHPEWNIRTTKNAKTHTHTRTPSPLIYHVFLPMLLMCVYSYWGQLYNRNVFQRHHLSQWRPPRPASRAPSLYWSSLALYGAPRDGQLRKNPSRCASTWNTSRGHPRRSWFIIAMNQMFVGHKWHKSKLAKLEIKLVIVWGSPHSWIISAKKT